MKKISITKRIALAFDGNGIATADIEAALQELKKEYGTRYVLDERNTGLSVQDGFLYITIIGRELKEKSAIGFKR